jgi:hypothetical protein
MQKLLRILRLRKHLNKKCSSHVLSQFVKDAFAVDDRLCWEILWVMCAH